MAITPLKKMFGERIRMYLVTNKIRQQELARRLSVSSSAVSQMLTGKIVPSMQQLDKICEVLSLECSQSLELRDWLTRIRIGIDNIKSPFNELLRLYRTRRGLSIGQLSKRTGITVARLNALENSGESQPTADEALRLSAVLECESAELMEVAPLLWQAPGAYSVAPGYQPALSYAPPSVTPMVEIGEEAIAYDQSGRPVALMGAQELFEYWEQPDWIDKIANAEKHIQLEKMPMGTIGVLVIDGMSVGMAVGLEVTILLGHPDQQVEGGIVLRALDGGKFELRLKSRNGLTGCVQPLDLVASDARRFLPVLEVTIRPVVTPHPAVDPVPEIELNPEIESEPEADEE